MKVYETCCKNGTSNKTYCVWKSKYDVMEALDIKHMSKLEEENSKLIK